MICDFWMWHLKDSVRSKTSLRNVASVTTLTGVLSSRISGSGKGPTCRPKCIHTVFEFENFKPFSCIHVWTLFTQNCIALSTVHNDLPCAHKAKSSTNKEASLPFQIDLTVLFNLMWKRAGDRTLPCGTPIFCPCSSDNVESTLKGSIKAVGGFCSWADETHCYTWVPS